jgi:hypothetical protein
LFRRFLCIVANLFFYKQLQEDQTFTLSAELPPVSTTPAANFATSSAYVVDTGGKFASGVNDASGKLPPVSTTPAANLPPRWQTIGAISDCWQSICYTLLPKGVQKK